MAFVLTETVIMNVVLTLIIAIMGMWTYMKKKSMLSLYIGAAFALFFVSHVLTLLGYGNAGIVILPLRGIGYLVIVYGLYVRLTRKR